MAGAEGRMKIHSPAAPDLSGGPGRGSLDSTPPGEPMSRRPAPRFHELDRAEAEALLARNHVGRIAFTFHDKVDIEPIHYVYADGVINCRTTHGTKLETLAHHPWVAFEVDEIEGPLNWRSVVARGTAYLAQPEGSEADVRAYQTALDRLRSVAPEIFTRDDPTPFRSVLLRIHVDGLTGRAATMEE
jgi:nitroimidazol reductase NimA-like FMN-containing flavoprotein (pyridoxamine 5'-phosphate oxidase superfamily)